jgi:hypothetical protein
VIYRDDTGMLFCSFGSVTEANRVA